MIFRKTERYYKEGRKTWLKHGMWDKETYKQTVKRVTIWFLFIPIFWFEKVINHNL